MGVRLIVGFAFSFMLLTFAPALLQQPLAAAGSLRVGDALDLLTPVVLVTFYYLLYRSADDWSSEPPTGPVVALFVLAALCFVDAHGMRLAANAIGRAIPAGAAPEALAAAHFYRAELSAYLGEIGTLGLAAALLWRHYQPLKKGVDLWHLERRHRVAIVASALLYGITAASTSLDRSTVGLSLVFALAVTALFLTFSWRQRQLSGGPVFTFLGMGYMVKAAGIAVLAF